MMTQGDGRPRRAHRRRQHRRARPEDTSVGYGGLPNADGVVQLDSCCMHGPKKRAGGVGAHRRRAHAVARRQGGDGRDRPSPARRQGRAGLRARHGLQDRGRPEHRDVARRRGSSGSAAPIRCTTWIRPSARRRMRRVELQMMAEGLIDPNHFYGTINCNGVNAKGEICGVTTTSGLAWKIPGRVGDSPILGAGLYVDGEVGAAGSTGRGEANLYSLRSFLIVEEHAPRHAPEGRRDGGAQAHQGEHGREAAAERRTASPTSTSTSTSLNAKGEHAGVAMYGGTGLRHVRRERSQDAEVRASPARGAHRLTSGRDSCPSLPKPGALRASAPIRRAPSA